MLKKQSHPSEFEVLTGFVKQIYGVTASPAASKKAAPKGSRRERVFKAGQGGHERKGVFQKGHLRWGN